MVLSVSQVKVNNWHSQNDMEIDYGNYARHCELIVYIYASVFNGGHSEYFDCKLPTIYCSRSRGTNINELLSA